MGLERGWRRGGPCVREDGKRKSVAGAGQRLRCGKIGSRVWDDPIQLGKY